MPAHHNLEAYLDANMHAVGLFGAKGTPLFRSADWHGGALTKLPMHRIDVWRMIRRRSEKAGIDADMCCHTFRATGLTNFLANGGTLENAQAMADHASRARRSSMIAPAMRLRSTRSNGLRFKNRHICVLHRPLRSGEPGAGPDPGKTGKQCATRSRLSVTGCCAPFRAPDSPPSRPRSDRSPSLRGKSYIAAAARLMKFIS